MATTLSYQPRRRVVRRARPTLDTAMDAALSDLPPEIRPLVADYARNMADAQRLRSELGTVMTRCGVRWRDVDSVVRRIVFAG